MQRKRVTVVGRGLTKRKAFTIAKKRLPKGYDFRGSKGTKIKNGWKFSFI